MRVLERLREHWWAGVAGLLVFVIVVKTSTVSAPIEARDRVDRPSPVEETLDPVVVEHADAEEPSPTDDR